MIEPIVTFIVCVTIYQIISRLCEMAETIHNNECYRELELNSKQELNDEGEDV
jgi:hypothetical protein